MLTPASKMALFGRIPRAGGVKIEMFGGVPQAERKFITFLLLAAIYFPFPGAAAAKQGRELSTSRFRPLKVLKGFGQGDCLSLKGRDFMV